MMTDTIRQYLQSLGVAVTLKDITVQPLPEILRCLCVPDSGGHSFQAVADTIFNLEMEGYNDLAYVLGYGLYRMPLELAVIRVGDRYYDPVQRAGGDLNFAVAWELSANELTEFVAEKNRPPEFMDFLICKAAT